MRVGTAGWSIPRDAAESFPGEGAHLERYGRVLQCAEINSSFYRPPMDTTWRRWAAAVPEGFKFAVKAPKAITHEAKLVGSGEALAEFIKAAGLLGDRLGPLLFQLPPKLAFEVGLAEEFFGALRESYAGAVALEPRHDSWFGNEAAELLVRAKVARVAADPARVEEAAVPGGWDGLVYYRLHGSPRTYYSRYTEEYVDGLAGAVRGVRAEAEVWVIFDNTASGAAIHNALELGNRV